MRAEVDDFNALPSESVAPRLAIVPSGNTVTFSWSALTAEWVLQESSDLVPTNWRNAPTGTNNPANIPATETAKFYRLVRP